tara:strand:+ start:297 stop:860 length:564 start_codon:yes stop_codon:yes gene_type:complete
VKKICITFAFLLIVSCTSKKKVYWCGDHPCINKKEKAAYFKKTGIVEIKILDNNQSIKKSDMENITQQAKLNEKNRIKKEKELKKIQKEIQKEKLKAEKIALKSERISEKQRLKREKELLKEEKKRLKREKKLSKKNINKDKKEEKVTIDVAAVKIDVSIDDFNNHLKRIKDRNIVRSYPDINDIPN